MAHSLEARLPYLDHRLYDLAKDIPVDLKMRGGVEKAVLRNAADGLLPDEIRLRRKTGFMITSDPVDLFGTDRDRLERLRKYLSKEAFARAGVFSLGAYRLLSLVARMPLQVPLLRRARRAANKAIMYMLQVHMLHEQFVVDPPWQASVTSTGRQPLARTDRELVSLAATDS
jgi:asparagine synthase (glutamine-hydrolysing)